MINQYIYWSLLALSGTYVMLRGGAPERVGMAILVIGSVAWVAALNDSMAVRFRSVEVGGLAVDLIALAAFILLALKAERFWPLWVTGFHGVGVATHAAMLLSPDIVPWAYAAGQALWSYPMMLIMVVAARRHRMRLARNGVDRSWTASSARSGRSRHRNGPPA